MSKNRIKIQLPTISSRDDAEAAMNDLALCANNKRKLTTKLDAAVLKLQDEAAPGLAQCDQEIALKTDALRIWADMHPEEFPKGKKTITFLCGAMGFRTGTPKLALISRAWNWDKVLDAVLAKAFQFTRTKTELDKESILAFVATSTSEQDRAATEANILRPIGVKVTQDESFFVEPALTEVQL